MPHSSIAGRGLKKLHNGIEPLLVPVLVGFRMISVGVTKGYELLNDGVLESVMIGRRRYLKVESLKRVAESGGAKQREQHAPRQEQREESPTYGDLNTLISTGIQSMSREETADAVRKLRIYAKAVTYYAQMKWPDFKADEPAAEPAPAPAEIKTAARLKPERRNEEFREPDLRKDITRKQETVRREF